MSEGKEREVIRSEADERGESLGGKERRTMVPKSIRKKDNQNSVRQDHPQDDSKLYFCVAFINLSWYCVFAFTNFRGPRDFINGGGLLIQGGDYSNDKQR